MVSEKPGASANQIILRHTPASWIAEFHGPLAREMAAISGADTVPTGFSGHVPGAVVRSAIALLNPGAEVVLADAAGAAPATSKAPAAAQPAQALDLAAEVVRQYSPGKATESAQRITVERAVKIKKSLGLIVACSYLRERGWSFEAAHQALMLPRRTASQ